MRLDEIKGAIISILLSIIGKLLEMVGNMTLSEWSSVAAIFAGVSAGIYSWVKILKHKKNKQ